MCARHDRSHDGWTRRAPGRTRAALGLLGGLALCVEAFLLRGPVVAGGAAVTAATIAVATLHHERVVRWSDDHGPLANLAIAPPAAVAYACAFRAMPVAVAALLGLATGLVLALLWLVVAGRRRASAPEAAAVAPAPERRAPGRPALPAPAAPRLWARTTAPPASGDEARHPA